MSDGASETAREPTSLGGDGISEMRGETPRVALCVRVETQPPLADCLSVNISQTGLGLVARADMGHLAPKAGSRLQVALRLPDGTDVGAASEIVWVEAASGGPHPTWAMGVRFVGSIQGVDGLGTFVRGHRLSLAVAFAGPEEADLVRRILDREAKLYFADTVEDARTLASRGDVAAVMICGDEKPATLLADWISTSGRHGGAGPRPRILYGAPISSGRLVELFNSGKVFRWMPPPIVPAVLRSAVEDACADYGLHLEREHIAAALESERKAASGRRMSTPVVRGTLPLAAMTFFSRAAAGAKDSGLIDEPPLLVAHAIFDPPETLGRNQTEPLTEVRRATMVRMSQDRATPEVSVQGLHTASAVAGDADRYGSADLLAEGGMGVVVACTDARLGRRVAMKQLQPRYLGKSDFAQMLEREARVTGSLEHPNIIPIYDAGRTADGAPFYVMKLIGSPTLGDVLDRLRFGDSDATAEYSLGRLLRDFVQVCRAVDFAHSRGVVHCDLKPANILLGSFGEVLVVDWGLAYLAAERTVCRGGTFGYVAPEQLVAGAVIDARTDVYALGSILYELLCLESTFPDDADYVDEAQGLPRHPNRMPPAPRTVAPERTIAEDLEEISLHALGVAPTERFGSAGELAAAIEAHLEGTKERERRQRRADEICEQADGLADNYFEMLSSRPERLAEVDAMRVQVAPWAPPVKKQALWDAEDSLAVTDTLAVRTLQAAASAYEKALDEVREHVAARRGLARLYAAELQRAEERGDELNSIYFDELVKQFDDGTIAQASSGGGSLTVDWPGGEMELKLSRMENQNRRMLPLSVKSIGRRGIKDVALGQGGYMVSLHVPGALTLRFPIVIKAGTQIRIFADTMALGGQPTDEILVPGGPALVGGEGADMRSRDLREVDVPSFFIQEKPVSFGDYLEFLRHVRDQLGDGAVQQLLPRHGTGTPFWKWGATDFVPADIGQWGTDVAALRNLPAFGLDLRSVEAYASWRAKQTGFAYRLPWDSEWEKAARGTDGRRFPWGGAFDASFCCMRESTAGPPRPMPCGAFETDVSPFGLRDLAGGVADWVLVGGDGQRRPGRELISRGGAWCDWSIDCALTARRPYLPTERTARVGFRLVRPGPATVGYQIIRTS